VQNLLRANLHISAGAGFPFFMISLASVLLKYVEPWSQRISGADAGGHAECSVSWIRDLPFTDVVVGWPMGSQLLYAAVPPRETTTGHWFVLFLAGKDSLLRSKCNTYTGEFFSSAWTNK